MKTKKLFLSFLACGVLAMGFTGCVDDNESASVTDIRSAKAAQLNALAAMKNAEAEVAKIMGIADVAYRNAETAHQLAIAAGANATAEQQEIANAIANATLAADIEAAQKAAEVKLANSLVELEDAKAELVAALASISTAKRLELTNLIGDYDEAIAKIYGATSGDGYAVALITAQANLLKAQKDLITADAAQNEIIAAANLTIAKSNAKITVFTASQSSTFAEVSAANDAAIAKAVVTTATALETGELATQADDQLTLDAVNLATTSTLLYMEALDKESNAYRSDPIVVAAEVMTKEHADGTIYTVTKGSYSTYDLNEVKLTSAIQELLTVQHNKEELLPDLQDAYDTYIATAGYKNAVKAVATAKSDYADDKTEENSAAITIAETALATEIANNGSSIADLQTGKDDVQTEVDKVAELQSIATDVATGLDDYNAAVAKYVAQRDANANADIAEAIAGYESGLQNATVIALAAILTDTPDYEALILAEKEIIATQEKNIMASSDMTDQSELIAYYEAQIAGITAQISTQETLAASIKAEIDVLIAAL